MDEVKDRQALDKAMREGEPGAILFVSAALQERIFKKSVSPVQDGWIGTKPYRVGWMNFDRANKAIDRKEHAMVEPQYCSNCNYYGLDNTGEHPDKPVCRNAKHPQRYWPKYYDGSTHVCQWHSGSETVGVDPDKELMARCLEDAAEIMDGFNKKRIIDSYPDRDSTDPVVTRARNAEIIPVACQLYWSRACNVVVPSDGEDIPF